MAFTVEWAGNPRDEPDMDRVRQKLAEALGPNIQLSPDGRFYEVRGPRICLTHVVNTLEALLGITSICENCDLDVEDFNIEEA